MKLSKLIVIMAMFALLLAVPGIAEIRNNACSPAGVWYSTGYVATIIATVDGKFTIRYDPVYDVAAYGYKSWTSWPGQLVKTGPNRYRIQAISMFTALNDSLELDGVRGWMEFTDCDNLKISYDFFGGYFDLNKVPFVDPPEVSYLPPEGLIETYHRMPTKCPACNAAGVATVQPQLRRR